MLLRNSQVNKIQYVGRGIKLPCCIWTGTCMGWPTQKFPEPTTFGVVMEIPSYWHDPSLTQFLVLILFLEVRGWSWKFQASNHSLIFLMPSPHPGVYHMHCLIRKTNASSTQKIWKRLLFSVTFTFIQFPNV